MLAETGIRSVINGPITYTIDGAPLVGPIPGKRNAYCIIGLRAGLGEGGGQACCWRNRSCTAMRAMTPGCSIRDVSRRMPMSS